MSEIYFFIDGSCIKPSNDKITWKSGWAIYIPNMNYKLTGKLPLKYSTNNIAELVPVGVLLDILNLNYEVNKNFKYIIVSDSEYMIKTFTEWCQEWKKTWIIKGKKFTKIDDVYYPDWRKSDNKQPKNLLIIQHIHEELSKYPFIKFEHIAAHTNKVDFLSQSNSLVDQLAKDAANSLYQFNIPNWLK